MTLAQLPHIRNKKSQTLKIKGLPEIKFLVNGRHESQIQISKFPVPYLFHSFIPIRRYSLHILKHTCFL